MRQDCPAVREIIRAGFQGIGAEIVLTHLDAEKSKAIDELRREAVDLALAGAGKVIEKNLDDAQNRKLVESYLASIGTR